MIPLALLIAAVLGFIAGWLIRDFLASVDMMESDASDDGLRQPVEIQVKRRPDYLKVMKGGVV